ncbi:hypothetical protein CLOP_g23294 [Closterium sp. NIES-67]|nr:hypothetical protein CLOP_g23294 [Closterium sp. NIES-67]
MKVRGENRTHFVLDTLLAPRGKTRHFWGRTASLLGTLLVSRAAPLPALRQEEGRRQGEEGRRQALTCESRCVLVDSA